MTRFHFSDQQFSNSFVPEQYKMSPIGIIETKIENWFVRMYRRLFRRGIK